MRELRRGGESAGLEEREVEPDESGHEQQAAGDGMARAAVEAVADEEHEYAAEPEDAEPAQETKRVVEMERDVQRPGQQREEHEREDGAKAQRPAVQARR